MANFDKMRFAESLGAAVLGAAAYDQFKGHGERGGPRIDALRKFQRALIVAMSNEGFTEEISQRYLSRVSAILKRHRMNYISMVLQPSERNFDERLTSLIIFDHALQGDGEWQALLAAYSFDSPGFWQKLDADIDEWLSKDTKDIRLKRENRKTVEEFKPLETIYNFFSGNKKR